MAAEPGRYRSSRMMVELDPVNEKQTDSNDLAVAGGGRRLQRKRSEMMAASQPWFVDDELSDDAGRG